VRRRDIVVSEFSLLTFTSFSRLVPGTTFEKLDTFITQVNLSNHPEVVNEKRKERKRKKR